ncbi:glycosyltransferase [Candidatus Pelagibacter sp.]|nr:glycosyltransferase [Candidatus Pelagibacter sp.]
MKILISTNDFWNLINFRRPLINELKKKGYEIIILTNMNKKKKNFNKYMGLKVHHINFKSNFNVINDVINLISILLIFFKYKPEIVLNFTIKPILLCSLVSKLFNIKCINTITGFGNFYLRSKKFELFFVSLYKYFTSNNNYFFFHNKNDLKFFVNNKISKKTKCFSTMGSGVNLTAFNDLKPKLKKNINFLMISRLIYNKGVIEFLETVNLFKKKKNLYFELVGKDPDNDLNEIKQSELSKYKDLDNLKITNFTSNIKKKLKKTNFVVLPSYREGMPKSLIEAMSSGIPVIASNVAGNSDLIRENFNGFFCRPKSSKSLYKCILGVSKIKQKRYSKISKNCRDFAENHLNENKVTLKYLSLIKKII